VKTIFIELYKIIKQQAAHVLATMIPLWHAIISSIKKFFAHPLTRNMAQASILGAVLFLMVFILPAPLQKALIPSGYRFEKSGTIDSLLLVKEQKALEKEIARLEYRLQSYTPRSHYLVINSTRNDFFLYKGNTLIRQGKCSTGSYLQLENGDNQKWLFKTPKGEFRIRGKKTSPVWKKPDWAFVEEGLPVPSAHHPSRFEYGVLGDYALSLGHGYLIHGTLYQRYLGLPVTHGCVRLNDDDLEKVYHSLDIGSKVYIY